MHEGDGDVKKLFILFGLSSVWGCGDTLYVAHDTVVGINAAVSANRQQGQVVIGYDRDFAAVVPVIEPGKVGPDGTSRTDREAMAVFGCTRMETKSIFLTRYSDVISTGDAANKLAKTLGTKNRTDGAARLVTCGEDKEGKDKDTGNEQGNDNQSTGGNGNG